MVFKLPSVKSKAIELYELDRTKWIVLISRAFDCIWSLKCFCESLIAFDYRTQSNPIAWIRPRLISRSFSLVRVFETVILVISVKTEVEHLLPLELLLSALALSVLLGKSQHSLAGIDLSVRDRLLNIWQESSNPGFLYIRHQFSRIQPGKATIIFVLLDDNFQFSLFERFIGARLYCTYNLGAAIATVYCVDTISCWDMATRFWQVRFIQSK